MLFRFLLICFLPLILFAEDPWGEDADLLKSSSKHERPSRIADKFIRFYQNVISPIDGPRSHYYPSSSAYTYQAMARYGFLRGFAMGCDRIMRENRDPWIYPLYQAGIYTHKWDPPLIYHE